MKARDNTWATPARLWRKLKPESRRMRGEPTQAEAALWERLRRKRLSGVRFRRQHPLDRFVVDFFAPELRLVVEIDGPIHDRSVEQDRDRQARLEQLGYRVVRFTNEEAMQSLDGVLDTITKHLED